MSWLNHWLFSCHDYDGYKASVKAIGVRFCGEIAFQVDTFLGPFNRLPMHDQFRVLIPCLSLAFVVVYVHISQGHKGRYPNHSNYRTLPPYLHG